MHNNPSLSLFPALPQTNTITVPCTEGMPPIFRVTSLNHYQEARCIRYKAHLFHDKASLTVEWTRSQPDTRIQPCCLVSPRWNRHPVSHQGAVQINRLALMEHPEPEENLFRMVPHGWVKNRDLIGQAIELIDNLPRAYRYLFNAIFWNGERFRRYCMGPSSVNAHHNYDNGNLMHSVELAPLTLACAAGSGNGNLMHSVELALWMRNSIKQADSSRHALAVLVGLLHDAGKADEYQLTPSGDWKLTDRGKLLGHKITIIEWIAAAHNRYKLHNLPLEHYMALLHCLTSNAHAPEWLGIRSPRMAEAILLSGLDQASGQLEIMQRCATEQPGWGRYHDKLRGKQPYQPEPIMNVMASLRVE